MNKKNVFLWALYDFANSVVMITFFLYFSQWLVVDKGVSDFWFNMTFVGSSLLFVLTAPIVGQIIDKKGLRLPGLRVATALSAFGYAVTGLIALYADSYVVLAAVCFAVTTWIYLLSFVFYTPLITELSDESHRGRVSGYGQTGNWLGQIAGVLIALPFASGTLHFIGEPGRAQAFIPGVIVFVICTLPMLFFFKEKAERKEAKISIVNEYRQFWTTTKMVFAIPSLGIFLFSYFFFSDALLTFSNNFPIFLERVFGTTDAVKTYLMAAILITSAIGSLIAGWVSDRVGHKKTLVGVLIGWIILLPIIATAKNFTVLSVFCILAGIFFGAVWTVSRAVISYLTPPDRINTVFTYHILAERFATLIGPLTWGVILTLTKDWGLYSYRFAMIGMSVLVLIGLFLAVKVRSDKLKQAQL